MTSDMISPPRKNKGGRPKKPPGQKCLKLTLYVDPALLDQLQTLVQTPDLSRSACIHAALDRLLAVRNLVTPTGQ